MTVPSCSTCRHAVTHVVPREMYLRCAHPRVLDVEGGDRWFASVVRGFETDEQGREWCGPIGTWHEPRDEDQAA